MPFDLGTAKPVQDTEAPAGGFDLSSAKPVEEKPKKAASKAEEPSVMSRAMGGVPGTIARMVSGVIPAAHVTPAGKEADVGMLETGAELASGAIATPVAGLAGLAGAALPGPEGQGASWAERVQRKLTYQPRTRAGKEGAAAVSLPIEVASSLLGKAGGAAGSLVGPKTEAAGSTIGEAAIPAVLALEGGRRVLTSPVAEAPPTPGKDVSPLRDLTPVQAERLKRMKAQGVEPTLGQVTQEPSQVRFEQQTAPTEAGRRIAQRYKEQDAALKSNIEVLKGKEPDIGLTEPQTGRSVRTALEKKAESEWQKVNEKYEEARASGETKQAVPVDKLTKWLADNESASVAVKELRAITTGLKKLTGEAEAPEAKPIGGGKISGKIMEKPEAKEAPKVTIDDLEFLRQEAGKLAQKDGSAKAYMNDVRRIIDDMTEGQGGEKYKQARLARKKWGDEFEERVGVADILEKKTRSDYKVAVEDVWRKAMVTGSDADLANIIDSLKTAEGDNKAIASKSLKDLQTRTLDHLVESATDTGTFSPAAFKKSMRSIGVEKLKTLLGDDAVKKLQDTLTSAEEVKKMPVGGKVAGSDTVLNARTMAEKLAADHAEHIMKGILPRFAGRVVEGVMEGSRKRAQARTEAAAVEEALTPRRASLADIAEQAKKVKGERSKYLMKEYGKRATPAAAATIDEDNK